MDNVKKILLSYRNIDNNIDNKNLSNIDNTRYALKDSFELKTEEASTAKEIASSLKDTANFALHYSIVQRIGPTEALRLLKETQEDVKYGLKRGKPIRNPAALYNWKVGRYLRKKQNL